jgi:sugar lactone lactonase YvrE
MKVLASAELLDDAGAAVGEGPAWDAISQRLTWVDITSSLVHVADQDGQRLRTYEAGRHVGAALPAAGGGWLLVVRDGFAFLAEDGEVRPLIGVEMGEDIRFNDAKCDPAGRAFAGTMPYVARSGAADLYRLAPGPRVISVFSGLSLSNGMGWSPDGRRFWFIDSPTGSVCGYEYDVADAVVGKLQTVVSIPGHCGMPDGMCVDDAGCLWVCLWGGSAVHRYTPRGELDGVIELPVTQVTSCAFGGSDGHTLFITSAVHELSEAARRREPLAGGLFAARVEQAGPPAALWTGVAS